MDEWKNGEVINEARGRWRQRDVLRLGSFSFPLVGRISSVVSFLNEGIVVQEESRSVELLNRNVPKDKMMGRSTVLEEGS